jgi:hypothetical protein
MKILYVISCNGGGNGGHNHSLNHISKAISQRAEIKIISVGLTEVNVLKNNKNYLGKFDFKWTNIFTLNKKFKTLFTLFNPDVIHCFDGSSALLLMAQPVLFKKKVIYTKCGGPNERASIAQVVSDVVLFSKENYMSYDKNKRFKNTDLHLIPNRIIKVSLFKDDERAFKKDITKFNFVRVARIGKSYFSSIKEAINLVAEVQQKNIKKSVKLYLIGKIESEEIYVELQAYAEEKVIEVVFITNDLTNEASRLLYLADAVIGTGRGVMEAMSLGIPTFVPVKGKSIPCLLRESNFNDFFNTNFSPRGFILNFDESIEIDFCLNIINNQNIYDEISLFSENIAQSRFVVNNEVVEKYLNIYKNVKEKKSKNYLLKNIFPLLYYINAFRRAAKRI